MTLSEYLRAATADVHRDAESSEFVTRFVSASLDRETHARHLLALHPVYATLEAALERRRDDDRLGAFHLPALWRTAAIEADLGFLLGAAWRQQRPVAAAAAYAERLAAIDEEHPILLVSHAYVRYVGDLSGGQILGRMAARQLGLDGDGLRFYDFSAIGDIGAFKSDFRRRLDALALDDGEREAVVSEARAAFRLNAAIFDQIV